MLAGASSRTVVASCDSLGIPRLSNHRPAATTRRCSGDKLRIPGSSPWSANVLATLASAPQGAVPSAAGSIKSLAGWPKEDYD